MDSGSVTPGGVECNNGRIPASDGIFTSTVREEQDTVLLLQSPLSQLHHGLSWSHESTRR